MNDTCNYKQIMLSARLWDNKIHEITIIHRIVKTPDQIPSESCFVTLVSVIRPKVSRKHNYSLLVILFRSISKKKTVIALY